MIREALAKIGEKQRAEKEVFKQMQKQQARENKLVEMQKSANERELDRFMKEAREEQIKEALQEAREERQRDISFNHNPLDVPNITKEGDFSILKQKNLFTGRGNMFMNQGSILHSNPNLLNNDMRLLS